MLDKLTGKPVHLSIQVIAMMGIAAGLPTSKIPLSIGTMLLGLNVILSWNWRQVWKNWISSKFILLLLCYVAFELLSIFWSTDKASAWNLVLQEMPLYTIPLAIVAIPLPKMTYYVWIVLTFIVAVFLTSFVNVGTYFHWWGNKSYDDIRSLSLFVSHQRYAMMIVMALVFCVSWFYRKFTYRWIAVVLAGWFVYYTNLSQIGTGLLTLSGIVLLLIYFGVKSMKTAWLKISLNLFSLVLVIGFVIYVFLQLLPKAHQIEITQDSYGTRSANGNLYLFDVKERITWENGYPVQAFLVEDELRSEWNKVSSIDYDLGTDLKGNPIKIILMRYMSSKGLKKDSADFQLMTQADVRNVENGLTSIELTDGGLKAQLYRVRFQLHHSNDPNGKSLLERVEFLKAGIKLLKDNWLFGVGVGDLHQAFKNTYKAQHSKLLEENQHITHNQFLTTWIAGGLLCFLSFCLWWVVQLKVAFQKNAWEWLSFLVITLLSFCIEDTLQTQAGVTFVAFFFAFFCIGETILYPPREAAK